MGNPDKVYYWVRLSWMSQRTNYKANTVGLFRWNVESPGILMMVLIQFWKVIGHLRNPETDYVAIMWRHVLFTKDSIPLLRRTSIPIWNGMHVFHDRKSWKQVNRLQCQLPSLVRFLDSLGQDQKECFINLRLGCNLCPTILCFMWHWGWGLRARLSPTTNSSVRFNTKISILRI